MASLRDSNFAKMVSKNRYLNSGVLVMNPHLLDSAFEERVYSAIQNYSNLGFQWHDQCVLNFVMEGRVGLIDKKYNHQFPTDSLLCSNSPVLHFTGSQKPWTASNDKQFAFGVRKWRSTFKSMLRAVADNGDLGLRMSRLRENLGAAA
jgi:lipopolysaccharide biosynthesis glycosyltransferase